MPEMQAVLRGRMNSKPSPETRVMYSWVDMLRVVWLVGCLVGGSEQVG